VDNALQLRLLALVSIATLYLRIALPGTRISAAKVADNYQRVSHIAAELARMQHPASGARLYAIL
jgi:hypothetical protein